MRGIKTSNEYARAVNCYDEIPKAVWAAIAISVLTCGGDCLDEANERVMQEWLALHEAGIVPQKPPIQIVATTAF
jgi:hypothetical protein